MQILLVVSNPANWPLEIDGVEVVAARQYLTDPSYATLRNVRVFNVCRSYSYQSLGYYVSLLAEARGHKPTPDVVTIQDMKSASLVRVITDDLDSLIRKTLRTVHGEKFTLSIYFGQTMAKRDRALGRRLFGLLRVPMMRAQFTHEDGEWRLEGVRPISTGDIPESHRPYVVEAAEGFFRRGQWGGTPSRPPRYHLAVLVDPGEKHPPSDEQALRKFTRVAARLNVGTELIEREDFDRVGEFDALFIRVSTYMNHYTYRFSRRADADGLAVIDDPVSISRCTNKVYLTERLMAAKVPIPETLILHRDNADAVLERLGLPLVLKQPDSAFSVGVTKAHTREEYYEKTKALLDDSEMIIAQRFIPTAFDWRIGVLDGRALYACKYFMARNHWQIYEHKSDGQAVEGHAATLPVDAVPRRVIATALKAAAVIGDGLYGVDLKQVHGKACVIEVNDNPSIDSGVEDRVLKDRLYESIIESLIRRIERIREGAGRRTRRRAVRAL